MQRCREEAKASSICLDEASLLMSFSVHLYCTVFKLQRYSCTFGIPVTLVPGLGEACAALDTRNPKNKERWKHLRDLEQWKQLCPTATFRTNSDAAKLGEVFIGKDGSTCLGRLVRLVDAQNPSRKKKLVVSHRESIRYMVRFSQQLQPHQPVYTPHVCMAIFKCKLEGQEKWNFQGLVCGGAEKEDLNIRMVST